MSFNYLLESDMYKQPFELSRVQAAGQGPLAATQGFMQGADFGMGMQERQQGMVARDIEIGVGQMKAQEAQMRLAAMDQELMVGMNKEAYLAARANRKLLEFSVKSQIKKLEMDEKTSNRRDSSELQKAMMALSGKINAEGMTGQYGAYKKVLDYKDGKARLRPETDDEYRKRGQSENRKADNEDIKLEQGEADLELTQAKIESYQGSGGRYGGGAEGISKQQKLFTDNARKTPVPGKPGYFHVPELGENGMLGMRPETDDEHGIRVKEEEIKQLTSALGQLGKKDPLANKNSQQEQFRAKITSRLSDLLGLGKAPARNDSKKYSPTGRGLTNQTWEPSETLMRAAIPALQSTLADYSYRNRLKFLESEFTTQQISRYMLFKVERFIEENDRLRNDGAGSRIVKMSSKTAFMSMISEMAKNPSGSRRDLREFYKR